MKADWFRYAWREFATQAAAVSVLAENMREATETILNKQDREALARVMIRTSAGRVEGGFGAVEWRLIEDETTRDMEYRFPDQDDQDRPPATPENAGRRFEPSK